MIRGGAFSNPSPANDSTRPAIFRGIPRSSTKCPLWPRQTRHRLSKPEKDLRRYMQVILPDGESPADYIKTIRAWPSVEEAWLPPEISLPKAR